MTKGLYSRLAFDGIKKNGKLYIPYIVSIIGMVAITYVLRYLSEAPALSDMQAGANLRSIMAMGTVVMLIFSAFFLFYTNSFLSKRRNSEFALYNILGMNKMNVVRILGREYIFVGFVSIASGIGFGILLSKLFELILMKMCGYSSNFIMYFSKYGVLLSGCFFALILFVLYIFASVRVLKNKPIDLLKSKRMGEREPKANVLFALAGFVLLAFAYYIAVSIQNPVGAITYFFIAVLMVIAATYLLFISGSVMLCRILKKNKNYYYSKKHFVSLSGMIYRMRRNGAGLASICILSTMILVMITSAGSLYFGKTASIKALYPRQFMITVREEVTDGYSYDNDAHGIIKEEINKFTDGILIKDRMEYKSYNSIGVYSDSNVTLFDADFMYDYSNENACYLEVVPLDDYNLLGEEVTLEDNEVLIYASDGVNIRGKDITIGNVSFEIAGKTDKRLDAGNVDVINIVGIVVKDFDKAISEIAEAGKNLSYVVYTIGFDTELDKEEQNELYGKLSVLESDTVSISARSEAESTFGELYASLFLLGIFLSVAFMGACVLIMYYKQLTEGYEDAAGYKIMRNVGMTKREIGDSVNSQTLITFFSPLVAAGLHLAFSAPMVHKILILFGVSNLTVFVITYIGCFLAFALLYYMVYKKTVKAYIEIVSH